MKGKTHTNTTFFSAFRHDPHPLPAQDHLRLGRRGERQRGGEVGRPQEAGGGRQGGRGRRHCRPHREGRGEGERAARQQATDQAGHPRDVAVVRQGVGVIRLQCVYARAVTQFTKPGDRLLAEPCKSSRMGIRGWVSLGTKLPWMGRAAKTTY